MLERVRLASRFRMFVCCEGRAEPSQTADDRRCNRETPREHIAKLDRTKNDDEIAYAFFKFCMSLDLSEFHMD